MAVVSTLIQENASVQKKSFHLSFVLKNFFFSITMPLHPTVLWAQRADVLYLTVEISDIKVSYCCCCLYIVFLMAYTLNFL